MEIQFDFTLTEDEFFEYREELGYSIYKEDYISYINNPRKIEVNTDDLITYDGLKWLEKWLCRGFELKNDNFNFKLTKIGIKKNT